MLTLIISTFAMAILPGTETLGVSAAIIFVMLRCIQGMAIGGEIPTAITFCAEHFPNKQGFAVSIVFACLSIGILLTSLVYAGLSHIPQDSEFYQQSWRIAFLIGALLSCLTYLLRKKLYETRAFLTFKQNPSAEPAINNQYSRLRQSMAGILIIAAIAMLMTQLFLFLPSYLGEYVGVDKQTIGDLLLRGSLIMIVGCIVGGLLSDYLDKQLMFISLLVILGGFCIYFYQQASQGQLATSAFNMICFMFGMIPATYSVIIANSFAIDFRCRGVGLTYNLSYSIFSAPVPALSVYLLNRYDNLLTPVWLLMVSILISLVGIALIKRPSY
jgi:MFS family permease